MSVLTSTLNCPTFLTDSLPLLSLLTHPTASSSYLPFLSVTLFSWLTLLVSLLSSCFFTSRHVLCFHLLLIQYIHLYPSLLLSLVLSNGALHVHSHTNGVNKSPINAELDLSDNTV